MFEERNRKWYEEKYLPEVRKLNSLLLRLDLIDYKIPLGEGGEHKINYWKAKEIKYVIKRVPSLRKMFYVSQSLIIHHGDWLIAPKTIPYFRIAMHLSKGVNEEIREAEKKVEEELNEK